MSRILSEGNPIARKQHRCDECRERINVGDRYRAQAGVNDDGLYRLKQCLRCEAGWQALYEVGSAHPDDLPPIGELLDALREECRSRDIQYHLPEPPPIDDRTLPMFGEENAPREQKPLYSEEVVRVANLLLAIEKKPLIVIGASK